MKIFACVSLLVASAVAVNLNAEAAASFHVPPSLAKTLKCIFKKTPDVVETGVSTGMTLYKGYDLMRKSGMFEEE